MDRGSLRVATAESSVSYPITLFWDFPSLQKRLSSSHILASGALSILLHFLGGISSTSEVYGGSSGDSHLGKGCPVGLRPQKSETKGPQQILKVGAEEQEELF